MHVKRLLQLMLFYGVITYIVLAVIFNLPFMMEKHHFSSGNSGLMISLFFLAIIAFLILGQDRIVSVGRRCLLSFLSVLGYIWLR